MSVQDVPDGFKHFSRHDSQVCRMQGVSTVAPPGGLRVPGSPTRSTTTESLHSRVYSPVPPIANPVLAGEVAAKYVILPPSPLAGAMTPPTHIPRSLNLSTDDAKGIKAIHVAPDAGEDQNSKEIAALQAKFKEITDAKKRVDTLETIRTLLAKPELDALQREKLTNLQNQIQDVRVDSVEEAERLLNQAKSDLRLLQVERRTRNRTGFVLPEARMSLVPVATEDLARKLKDAARLQNEKRQEMAREKALGELDAVLKSVQPQENTQPQAGVAVVKAPDAPVTPACKSCKCSDCSCCCVIM